MRRVLFFHVVLVTQLLMCQPASAARTTFFIKNRDRVCFYGASVTEQRFHTVDVETYVLTRFPKLPASGLSNEIHDLIYEGGVMHVDDAYSNLPVGDKDLKAGALYRRCYDVEVNDCIVDPIKAVTFIAADVRSDLKHPPHYSYLFNDCVDWAHGVIHSGVVDAERFRHKNDMRPDLLRYVSPKK